jgi:hypothetical protein
VLVEYTLNPKLFLPRRLGELLCAAGLLKRNQLEAALYEQSHIHPIRLGEIIVRRGWVSQTTVDFFLNEWPRLFSDRLRYRLGQYLCRSGLLSSHDLDLILEQQQKTGLKLGAIAVLEGYISSTTLNFFLGYLFPDQISNSPFMKHSSPGSGRWSTGPRKTRLAPPVDRSNRVYPSSKQGPEEDIPWIG